MKEKPTEWVSISDLMAGVMAVVMLLLVISVLQRTFAEIKHKQEMEQGVAAQKKQLSAALNDLKVSLQSQGSEELVAVDINSGKITLRDNVFDRGSACITKRAQDAIRGIEPRIMEFLRQNTHGQVVVEGHTDNLPVSRPVTDFARFCTVYDDNYTLSAARAREARRLLVGDVADDQAGRVIVAGYGDSHPLDNVQPSDSKNRRVEVHFVLQESRK
ncbi:OmpA family protein [Malikia sp.]|uniref:OmpA/MotB family protein n=1 Tax=Malikia sp. TaxID=2070706 RepID=UPI00263A21D2|nr:OmpA family protein [Malikia sp.]MDD2729044.1 OmpA family protein [Malikia sp.]